jgi:hypothetical protein
MNFDTIIYRQQAPFSGVVAGEQAIKIQGHQKPTTKMISPQNLTILGTN